MARVERRDLLAWLLCASALAACSSGPAPSDAGRDTTAPPDTAVVLDAAPATDVPDALDAVGPVDAADALDVAGPVDACTGTLCGSACVDTRSDVHHCGACATDCAALAHVGDSVQCVAGTCALAGHCAPGFSDCDSAAANGCETDLSSPRNCGVCGNACAEPTPMCTMMSSGYVCASGCGGMTPTRCAMACVDTTSNVANCGSCGASCPAPLNAMATCAASACGFVCNAGFADCDTSAANGCETALDTDPTHCGSCGNACPSPANGTATCTAGSCGVECAAGFHACAGNCVSDTALATCGARCAPCATPANATPSCDGTSCGFVCNAGWGDLDHDPSNGCEAATCATRPGGAVSWFRLEGNNADYLGANPGSATGGVAATAGEVGQALHFDGTGIVSASANGLPTGGADRSVEFWARLDAPVAAGQEAFFVGYGAFGSVSQTWQVGVSGGQALFFSQWGASVAGPVVPAGTWFHVAVATSGGTTTLYLNGAAVASGAIPINTPAGSTLYLGRIGNSYGATRDLIGALDEVTLYNRALTASEVLAIYAAGAGGKCVGCPTGSHLCGAMCASDTSVATCGGSCAPCPSAGPHVAGATCNGTACGLTCTAGFTDCDGDAANGCECGGAMTCTAGVCACPAGTSACGGACVDAQTDPMNCGACGNVCGALTHCLAGVCVFAPTSDVTLAPGTYHFGAVNVPAGVTVRTNGLAIVDVTSDGDVVIAGTWDFSGGQGGSGSYSIGGYGGDTGNPLVTHGGPGVGGSGPAGAPNGSGTGGGTNGGGVGSDGSRSASGGAGGGGPGGGAGGTDGISSCTPGGGGTIGAAALADLSASGPTTTGSGGGGGGGTTYIFDPSGAGGGGGGGGAIVLRSRTGIRIVAGGRLLADGGPGGAGDLELYFACGGGGGSGGLIYLSAPSISVSAGASISAAGGQGGFSSPTGQIGGAGGTGRIRLSVGAAMCTLAGSFNPPLQSGCAPSPPGGTAGYTYIGTYPM